MAKIKCLICLGKNKAELGKSNLFVCDECQSEMKKRRSILRGQEAAKVCVAKATKRGMLPRVRFNKGEAWCRDCGFYASSYDHRDYNKPLAVDPVCWECNVLRGPAVPLSGYRDPYLKFYPVLDLPFRARRWLKNKVEERGLVSRRAILLIAKSLGRKLRRERRVKIRRRMRARLQWQIHGLAERRKRLAEMFPDNWARAAKTLDPLDVVVARWGKTHHLYVAK